MTKIKQEEGRRIGERRENRWERVNGGKRVKEKGREEEKRENKEEEKGNEK